MILVVGGLGFVGSNVVEALARMGQEVVVTRHRRGDVPAFLESHSALVSFEQADAARTEDLLRVGETHQIDSIIHMGGSFTPGAPSPIVDLRGNFDQLVSILSVAEKWKVKRLTIASTVGVYAGAEGTRMTEEMPLPLEGSFSIPAHKKIIEIAASDFAKGSGIGTVCVRLPGMFGPWGNPNSMVLATRLVHAAVHQEQPALDRVFGGPRLDDGLDLCYIKDVALAIAMLHSAGALRHQIYNIGWGSPTFNRQLLESVIQIFPDADLALPPGRSPGPHVQFMDTGRLRRDTAFSPKYDLHVAVAEYADWLKAGNSR